MRKLLVAFALALAFTLGVASTLAIQHYTQRIENIAVVKVVGVGIYKDINFTVSLTQIDWGILEPGESKNVSAYVVNESNVPLTLSMVTLDWQPANTSLFVSLSWSYDGRQIEVDGYVGVIFSLAVDPAVSGIKSFSFVIMVIGSG